MAHAVAIAADPAAEAAQEEDNHDNDEYRSKRHGILPATAAHRPILRPRGPEPSRFRTARAKGRSAEFRGCGEVRRGAFPASRHCERSEAIHAATQGKNGLLRRFAPRNDEYLLLRIVYRQHLHRRCLWV